MAQTADFGLSGKNAFVTGVADDGGFGWQIAKSLQAQGARVFVASHPRTVGIVERLLRRLKGFRRIFSRFDKLDVMFAAFIHFALIVESLR